MVGWQRSIRTLSTHVVAQTIVILLRTLKAIIGKVGRSMVRNWLLRGHATVTRDE
jgi:hypothetical protein